MYNKKSPVDLKPYKPKHRLDEENVKKFLSTPLAQLEEHGVKIRHINKLEAIWGAIYICDLCPHGNPTNPSSFYKLLMRFHGMDTKSVKSIMEGLMCLLRGDPPKTLTWRNTEE